MYVIPGILALLFLILVRPQEFTPALRGIPFLYIFCALAIFGFCVDLRRRRARLWATPHLKWVVLFFLWCTFTLAVRNPTALVPEAIGLLIPIVLYVVIAHSVQTFRMLQVVVGSLLMIALFLASVGVHLGTGPWGCLEIDDADNTKAAGNYDGRSCTTALDCRHNDPEPGKEYICERVGLFGTFTVEEGRVRYLGTMQDPNELALVIGVAVPFAFGFFTRKHSTRRLLLLIATLVVVGTCIIMTQSRGGQLVLAVAVGAYFIKRYGVRGLALGAVLAAPMMLLGGREGEKATSSSLERIECLYTGISLWKQYPLLGVGQGQFTEHHFLTAHNSYLLVAAELGLPGMMIWSIIIYLCFKIPLSAMRRLGDRPETEAATAWAMALVASFAGMLVGIFFLSYAYEQALWIYIGLTGAFYGAVKTHDPEWEVTMERKDYLTVAGIDLALLAFLFVYSRLKVQ